MKKSRYFLFVFLFGCIISSSLVLNIDKSPMMPSTERGDWLPERMILSYEEHPPITILNDSEFFRIAGLESWDGDGNESTPFIIDGYNITDISSCIYIENVTVHFTIRDCFISSVASPMWPGINLENVTNGLIQDCHIEKHTFGIRLYDCEEITITGCNISQNIMYGIYTDASDELDVLVNKIYANDIWGAYFRAGVNWTILANTIYDNDGLGLYLWHGDFCNVSGNEIYNNTSHGIQFFFADNCTLEGNTVYNNGWTGQPSFAASGIYTRDCYELDVLGNELYNNTEHGIYTRTAENCSYERNIIYGNFGRSSVGCGIFADQIDNSNFTENTIYNNTYNGIRSYWCEYSTFANNTIYNNTVNGFLGESSTNCTVVGNLIYHNQEYGIYQTGCDDNTIYNNDIGWNVVGNAQDNGGDNFWNSSALVGNLWSDYDGIGSYTIDGTADSVDYHPWFSLSAGVSANVAYELGDTGNELVWNATAANPVDFELLKDGSPFDSDVWDGGELTIGVDGFAVGIHSMTLIVYHISGHASSSGAFVTVEDTTAPTWIVVPSDQRIDEGVALSVQFSAQDPSGIGSWWTNDTVNFHIDSTGLLTNARALAFGAYGLRVSVNDTYGNVNDYEIRIIIDYVPPTTTTTTTTSTTETTTPPPGDGGTTLILIAGGGGAAALIIIVIVLARKKQT